MSLVLHIDVTQFLSEHYTLKERVKLMLLTVLACEESTMIITPRHMVYNETPFKMNLATFM